MKTLFILIFFPALLFAQSSSEHFTLVKSVIDAGGGASSSANFALVSSFGQPTPIGVQSSANFTLYAGFLSPILSVSPLSPIQELVIRTNSTDAQLWWEAVPGAESYTIHRDVDYQFTPIPGNLVATVTDTTFVDTNVLGGPLWQQYYIILVNGAAAASQSETKLAAP